MASDSDHRVLLTGATGFIGQVVVPLLLAQGAGVLALTTDPKRVRDRWGIESVDVLTETEALVRESIMTFHPSVLVQLAWSGLPDYSPTACLANVESSARVIRATLDSGATRFVGAGSCWEYGDRTGRLEEGMTTTPTTVFAQAKSCIRQLLETMAVETGTEARWARVFYAYGSGQRSTSLIPMTIRAWQEGAAPELLETQRAIDLIHVDDVARGIVALALQDGPSGTFNLGSGHATRVADVVELVRAFVSGEELTSIPTSSTDTRASWADISKMQDSFGWQPAVDLSNGVRLMLDTGSEAVTQAVILAGGRGIRLAPLTDSIPKPMVDVNGEPFLAHLIALLATQGVADVLLLTGYRGEQIRDHFGSGGEFGLTIRYSKGPEEWSTGERLLAASDDLDSMFLLLYADNYVAFEMAKLLEHAPDSHASMVLTVCPKASGNIVLNPDGSVLKYLRDRSSGSGEFVEVGFSLTKRDRLLHAVELNSGSLPAAIESLTAAGEVRANVVSHPYFSVSDPQRLERTRQALSRRRVLLLDRDGVINVKAPTGEYVTRFEDFEPIMGNWRALATLAEQGFSFIIISNQAGVARGMIEPADLDYLHARMLEDMQDLGLNVMGVYVCPHHWDENCSCRKPLPGMFNLAADEHSFLLEDVIYVGDDVRDEAAALAAGCTSVLIGPEARLAGAASRDQFNDLTQAVPFIIDHYESRSRSARSSSRIDGGQ